MTLSKQLEEAFIRVREELYSDLKHGFPVKNNRTFWDKVVEYLKERGTY